MDDIYQKLLNASFRFVSYRPRSEKETRDFLQKKLKRWRTSATQTIPRVLARLGELGYIDDATFAAWWVEQRSTFRPKGALIIRQELLRKGIAKDVIDDVLTHGNTSERERARAAAEKKAKLWHSLPKKELKMKLFAYLARRGFSGDTTARIIDEITGNRVQ